jgi:hypothetical protein
MTGQGRERGGCRPTSPPCRWGGSSASGRKREGGCRPTPPPDSGPGLVPGSWSAGQSARVFRRRGGFCTGFHSSSAGKIRSLTRGGCRPTSPPGRWGGSSASGRKREGGLPANPPFMIHRFARYRQQTTGPVPIGSPPRTPGADPVPYRGQFREEPGLPVNEELPFFHPYRG